MMMTPQQQSTPAPPAMAIAEAKEVFGSLKLLRNHALMTTSLA